MPDKALVHRLDHIVLTVSNIEDTMRFYELTLGMEREVFHSEGGQTRYALRFGNQKINLHDRNTLTPTKAHRPTVGCGDYCLITNLPLEEIIAHLKEKRVPIEAGPVPRQGALGELRSIYFRDPDGNLVEIAEYVESKR